MFQHHQRDDVAMRTEIRAGGKQAAERFKVCPLLEVWLQAVFLGEVAIAHVPHRTVFARDIPTSPAFFHWAGVVSGKGATAKNWLASPICKDATDQIAGYV